MAISRSDQSEEQSEAGLLRLWGPLRAAMEEHHLTFNEIKRVVAYTGFDMPQISQLSQQTPGGGIGHSKGSLMTAIDAEFGNLPADEKKRFLIIAAEEAAKLKPRLASDLDETLHRLGWQYIHGHFLPLEVLEEYELDAVPESARPDLLKAATRFREGDLDGALTAACGAVDSTCARVYQEKSLGDPAQATSFQEKVMTALRETGSLDKLREDLVVLGWRDDEATMLWRNLKQSLNQAALVMQTLRRRMGDVHGSKEALRAVVFDSIKWAMIVTSFLG